MDNATCLWYEQPARNFNEALPLGNGRMGAMFYGGTTQEKISLNEDTLWTGWPRKSEMQGKEVFRKIQNLVLEGKTAEAEQLFESDFGDFLVQQYLPLGDLELTFGHSEHISEYRRMLSLDQGVGRVSYEADGAAYKREYFVSREYQVLAIRLSCSQKGKLSFSAKLQGKLKCTAFGKGDALFLEGFCPIAITGYGDYYRDVGNHHYEHIDGHRGVGYRAGAAVEAEGGSVCRTEDRIQVEGADSAVIYLSVRTNFSGSLVHPSPKGKPYGRACIRDLQRALTAGYSAIFERAVEQYREMFCRTAFSLFDGENSGLPTDRRLEKHRQGTEDPSLYVLLFNYGKYLTIAASQKGTRAMNLQGIWNEKILPPWSCNYTLNINTEMNYWPTLPLGLFECYEPLVELVRGLHENGKATAKQFYGKRGFVSHHATDVWCLTHPSTSRLPDSTKWGFWNMSSGWLAKMLFDYYAYTLDGQYLESIWPILSDCARFYQEMLIEQDGELILCPSTSPENTYLENGRKTAVDKTTAMTMQIVRDVFDCCIKAGEILDMDVQEYKALLPRLKINFLDLDGRIHEWYSSRKEWEPEHRHLSHLYGLFPGNQFTPEEKEAAKRVLNQRGDNGTGWSLAWKINLWARLGDGERAKTLLDRQLQPVSSEIDDASCPGGSYPNLLCAHPPFQIDGNFGACSGIIQMLLQVDEKGEPICLPALPKSWHSGRVNDLQIPGGRTVSFAWENGKLTEINIQNNSLTRLKQEG